LNIEFNFAHHIISQPGAAELTWINYVALPMELKRCEKEIIMKGFVQDIEDLAVKNNEFRRVLYTAKHCQLVLRALKPKEEIGAEVHKLDQFFRVEEGTGEAVLDGVRTAIKAGFAVVVPAGAKHNIINTGSAPLKLYTLYSPPNHRDGVVHHTRADAEADNEHFDGKTTE
jgi:mannose-6-phosphate isomerase-like protein (cupin superfamily)